jgi:hypothetical protein
MPGQIIAMAGFGTVNNVATLADVQVVSACRKSWAKDALACGLQFIACFS